MTPFQILLLTMSVAVIFFKTGNCADKTPPVCESVNVKTVLWRQIDTCRKCWGKQDVLKAYARRVVQDLLPRRVPKNIPMLLQYLTTIWEQVPKSTPDNSIERYILTVALADVIGGYLQSVALPIANEAYYAGNVDYKVMAQLYFLFEEVKMELGTDGGGWSKPCDMKRIPTKVSGLDLSSVGDKGNREACRDLHIPIEETNIEENEYKHKGLMNETHPGHLAPPGQQCLPKTTEPPKKEIKIPMPFLDDDQRPNAIAVPFKDQLLYSLHCMGSAHILVRYYMTALRCIGKKDKQAIMKFNCAFYNWIIINVIPHLHEKNKWYTGFGSVMRIIETMHQKGWSPQPDIAAGMNNGGQPGGRGGCQARPSLPETVPTMPAHEAPKEVEFPSEKLIKLLEILGLALLGLIAFLLVCCCCIRLLSSRDNQFKPLLSIYYKMTGQEEKEPAAKGGGKRKFRGGEYDETCATLNTERDSEFSMKYADTDETTSATSETEERVPKKGSKN